MSPAQMAVDAVFRQFGTPATFQPAVGASRPVRVLARRPDTVVDVSGTAILSDTASFELRISEVPVIGPEDQVVVDGVDYLIQTTRRLDPDRLVWTLDAVPT